jgi:CheY-like chemotaxis protein
MAEASLRTRDAGPGARGRGRGPLPRMKPLRVMLVEDEALVALMMEDQLRELGCEVAGSFAGLAAALRWLDAQAEPPDGAVLDVNLGGGERVFPLAHALRARGVPFVFATGYSLLPDDGFAEIPVLNKPVDLGTLWPAVEAFRMKLDPP